MEWEQDPACLEIINVAAVLYKAINLCSQMQIVLQHVLE